MAQIVLADDDGAVRDLLARALSSDGHQVTIAQDGAEALDQLIAAQPGEIALLVTDIDMPQLDGVTLAGKALAHHPKLAVVLMSGHSEQLGKASALGSDKVAVVSKPFKLDDVRKTIQALLA